jgi:spore coat assembly protein SafA
MSDEVKEKFAANEAAPCQNGQLYTIKPGDTLFLIAKRFNVGLSTLRAANPQIADPNVIYPGQTILIPAAGTVPATRPAPRPRPAAPSMGPSCPDGQIYVVVPGDTMFQIAQRFGVSLEALIQANPQVVDPDWIEVGQELCIPSVGMRPSFPNGRPYTVQSGDTLFEIARRNGLPLSVLIAANPQICDPDLIFPGQTIYIPAPGTVRPPLMPVEPPEEPEPPIMMPPPLTPPCPPAYVPPEMPEPPLPRALPRPCPPERPMPLPAQRPPARIMPRPPCPPERPRPLPAPMPPLPAPCPPGAGEQPMMYPMPVYVVVPWDECPYRPKGKKKRKHDRKHHCCH